MPNLYIALVTSLVEIIFVAVSILKDHGMYQTKWIVCIKRQLQSQLIVRPAVITSVMPVMLCGQGT